MPTITGYAADNSAIMTFEYSKDQGKTWIKITSATGLNSNSAQFSFQPTGLESGSQFLLFQVKDTAGNTSATYKVAFNLDQKGPVVSFITDHSKPFKESLKVRGQATDISGIRTIEYAVSKPENWILVDKVVEAKTSSEFSFNLPKLDDNNYPIFIRSTDNLGNVATNALATLVIDRLEPRVGGLVIQLGPEIIRSQNSSFITLSNLKHTLTVSVVGGPTQVIIQTESEDNNMYPNQPDSVTLKPIPNTTL